MVDELRNDRDSASRETVEPDPAAAAPPDDPIVSEVRAVREALFSEAGYDLEEFVRRLRVEQARSNHVVVTLPPKSAGSAT